MIVFVSGGCKNGKSTHAEKIAVALSKNANPLYYIATMNPADKEDEARIIRHQQSRQGLGFTTIEQSNNIDEIINRYDINGTFLLDSTTALLSNEMFLPDGSIDKFSADRVSIQLTNLISKVKNIVIVSDYIYSDAVLYDEFIKLYQKGLAQVDKTSALLADVVIEICYSQKIIHKGSNLYETIF